MSAVFAHPPLPPTELSLDGPAKSNGEKEPASTPPRTPRQDPVAHGEDTTPPQHPMQPSPPASPYNKWYKVGPYSIGPVIGSGRYGKVRLATHIEEGSEHAVKIIQKSAKECESEMHMREISIAMRVEHDYVVRMVDVMQSPSRYYLVLELVEGGDLFNELVRRRRLPVEVAKTYFHQVLYAVQHCHHDKQIAHRDIKPENILLSKDKKTAKLSDFGLSNVQDEFPGLKTVCGTIEFMAPELLRHEWYNGFLVDVWSLGVVLFMMLVGMNPFRTPGDSDQQVKERVMAGECPTNPLIPKDAADLIAKMLVKDPTARITITEALAHPWLRDSGVKNGRQSPVLADSMTDNNILTASHSSMGSAV